MVLRCHECFLTTLSAWTALLSWTCHAAHKLSCVSAVLGKVLFENSSLVFQTVLGICDLCIVPRPLVSGMYLSYEQMKYLCPWLDEIKWQVLVSFINTSSVPRIMPDRCFVNAYEQKHESPL